MLVRVSRTVHVSRFGESKFTMKGGATVRFQIGVETAPVEPVALILLIAFAARQFLPQARRLIGLYGGPPSFSTSRPASARA